MFGHDIEFDQPSQGLEPKAYAEHQQRQAAAARLIAAVTAASPEQRAALHAHLHAAHAARKYELRCMGTAAEAYFPVGAAGVIGGAPLAAYDAAFRVLEGA